GAHLCKQHKHSFHVGKRLAMLGGNFKKIGYDQRKLFSYIGMMGFNNVISKGRQRQMLEVHRIIACAHYLIQLVYDTLYRNALFRARRSQCLFSTAAEIQSVIFKNIGCLKILKYDLREWLI